MYQVLANCCFLPVVPGHVGRIILCWDFMFLLKCREENSWLKYIFTDSHTQIRACNFFRCKQKVIYNCRLQNYLWTTLRKLKTVLQTVFIEVIKHWFWYWKTRLWRARRTKSKPDDVILYSTYTVDYFYDFKYQQQWECMDPSGESAVECLSPSVIKHTTVLEKWKFE